MFIVINQQVFRLKNARHSTCRSLIASSRMTDRCPDSRQHFRCSKRLRDIIVRSEVQCLHLVLFMAPRRNHNDRHARPFPKSAQNFHTIYIRKSQIQNHQIRTLGCNQAVALLAGIRRNDIVTVRFQNCPEKFADASVILDNQNSVPYFHSGFLHPVFFLTGQPELDPRSPVRRHIFRLHVALMRLNNAHADR